MHEVGLRRVPFLPKRKKKKNMGKTKEHAKRLLKVFKKAAKRSVKKRRPGRRGVTVKAKDAARATHTTHAWPCDRHGKKLSWSAIWVQRYFRYAPGRTTQEKMKNVQKAYQEWNNWKYDDDIRKMPQWLARAQKMEQRTR